ncbi:titin-like [Cimex lectularius]|uniref:Uncharacterized protein n=1 Tax=Cimex lectularius TaxID=79782 RepID=A0A8I6RHI8_CIMLE|nr:titin-like [Cimex lectularius]
MTMEYMRPQEWYPGGSLARRVSSDEYYTGLESDQVQYEEKGSLVKGHKDMGMRPSRQKKTTGRKQIRRPQVIQPPVEDRKKETLPVIGHRTMGSHPKRKVKKEEKKRIERVVEIKPSEPTEKPPVSNKGNKDFASHLRPQPKKREVPVIRPKPIIVEQVKEEVKPVIGHKDMGVHPSRQRPKRPVVREKKVPPIPPPEKKESFPVVGHKTMSSHRKPSKVEFKHPDRPKVVPKPEIIKEPTPAPIGHRLMHVEEPEIITSTNPPVENRMSYPSHYDHLAKNAKGDGNSMKLSLNEQKREIKESRSALFQPYKAKRHSDAISKPTNRVVRPETKLADELQQHQIKQHKSALNQSLNKNHNQSKNRRNKHIQFKH